MLKVYPRKEKKAKEIRKEKKIPGILYGREIENQPIFVEEKEFLKIFSQHPTGFWEIELGGKHYQVILQDYQKDPISGRIIHFDFYLPSEKHLLTTSVKLEFIGSAPAERKGGHIIFNLQEVEIEVAPKDLPEKIEVDLSLLENVGQTIYVKDLKVSPKIKILTPLETPIVTASEAPKEETEPEAPPSEEAPQESEEKTQSSKQNE